MNTQHSDTLPGFRFPRWGLVVVALLALGLGAGLGAMIFRFGPPAPPDRIVDVGPGVAVLPAARPLPPFELTDYNGASFGPASLQGKWSFLFFGYTFCPDVCPATLAAFRDVHGRMAQTPGQLTDVQFVLVSVDPERDTPQRLREYVTYFAEDFLGVTGTSEQLDQLTRAVGALYMKVDAGAGSNYLVDHTASVFLLDPDGRLHAVFSAPLEPAQVVSAFAEIRDRRG